MKERFRFFKGFMFLILFLPMVVNSAECTTFNDIGGNQYESEILVASNNGWISCKDNFSPSKNTNRIEALKMALLAGGHNVPDSTEQCFDDVSTDSWQNKYACYGLKNGLFLVDRDNFNPADDINFAEASKLILRSMTNESYDETSNPWYKKYIDKMSLYEFNDNESSNLHRDYFIHILTEIKDKPNKQPAVEEPSISSANVSPSSVVIGDNITVTANLSKSLPSGYSIKVNYETSNSS